MNLTPDPAIGYRWYTWAIVATTWSSVTVKLGPLTVMRYEWDGWQVAVTWWGRWLVFDTGIRQHTRTHEQLEDALVRLGQPERRAKPRRKARRGR